MILVKLDQVGAPKKGKLDAPNNIGMEKSHMNSPSVTSKSLSNQYHHELIPMLEGTHL